MRCLAQHNVLYSQNFKNKIKLITLMAGLVCFFCILFVLSNYVSLSSVFRFMHTNDVRFVFIPSCLTREAGGRALVLSSLFMFVCVCCLCAQCCQLIRIVLFCMSFLYSLTVIYIAMVSSIQTDDVPRTGRPQSAFTEEDVDTV
jgi:hypothetical protein